MSTTLPKIEKAIITYLYLQLYEYVTNIKGREVWKDLSYYYTAISNRHSYREYARKGVRFNGSLEVFTAMRAEMLNYINTNGITFDEIFEYNTSKGIGNDKKLWVSLA